MWKCTRSGVTSNFHTLHQGHCDGHSPNNSKYLSGKGMREGIREWFLDPTSEGGYFSQIHLCQVAIDQSLACAYELRFGDQGLCQWALGLLKKGWGKLNIPGTIVTCKQLKSFALNVTMQENYDRGDG